MTTQLPTPTVTTSKAEKGGLVAGIGAAAVVLACAAACAIPLFAAVGVAGGGAALIAGAWPVAVGLLLLTAAGVAGLLWYRKSKRARAAEAASCACGGACGC
jgi:hypothetical protein